MQFLSLIVVQFQKTGKNSERHNFLTQDCLTVKQKVLQDFLQSLHWLGMLLMWVMYFLSLPNEQKCRL